MTDDDQPVAHERQAASADREAEDLKRRSERLKDEIEGAREDWEAKKADGSVPGARPDDEDLEGRDPPEADYPAKGDAD